MMALRTRIARMIVRRSGFRPAAGQRYIHPEHPEATLIVVSVDANEYAWYTIRTRMQGTLWAKVRRLSVSHDGWHGWTANGWILDLANPATVGALIGSGLRRR